MTADPCPNCHRAATGVQVAATGRRTVARPGDVGVCQWCTAVSVVDDDCLRRVPNPDEQARLAGDLRIQVYRLRVAAAIVAAARWN